MEASASSYPSSLAPVLTKMHQGILDFSKEFDVSLMDRVVMAFYSSTGQEVRKVDPIGMHIAHSAARSA